MTTFFFAPAQQSQLAAAFYLPPRSFASSSAAQAAAGGALRCRWRLDRVFYPYAKTFHKKTNKGRPRQPGPKALASRRGLRGEWAPKALHKWAAASTRAEKQFFWGDLRRHIDGGRRATRI